MLLPLIGLRGCPTIGPREAAHRGRLMPSFARFLLRVAVVAGLLLTVGTSALLAQERVGVNSAVNPQATGALPGAPPRRLVIGQDVIFNEHITTAETGQTQLLFLDESSMSIGPNSDLTIDQFVYDPKSGTGKLAMSATRGLLRYVGGKLSKQDNAVTLRTGTATLAVRGGAFIAQIGADGTMGAAFLYGKGLTVNGVAGGSVTVTRPGFQTIVLAGGVPSPPVRIPPGLLALFIQQLDGRSGSTGGAAVIPTDTTVANSAVSQTVSGDLPQSVQQATQNQAAPPTAQPNPPNPAPVPTTVTSTLQSTTTQTATTSAPPPVIAYAGGAFAVNNTPQQINGQQLVVGGDPSQASQLHLVNSPTAALPTALLRSGVSFCQCQYLQWGYRGGDRLTGNSSNDLISPIDHGPITFWVVGVATPVGDLSTLASQSATGTYTGHAIGSVLNNGSSYVAAGGFNGTYNFGPQTGTLTISNFDGKSFGTGTTPVKLPLGGANYTYNIAQTGVAGTINGSLYGPKAVETGGNFAVHTTLGPTYIASGIFAGKH